MKNLSNKNLNLKSLKFLNLLLILLFLPILNGVLTSQESIKIISVDQSNYPKMKAEVVVTNNSNQEVRTLSNTDIKIKDGGKDRVTNSIFCSPNVKKFSLVLTIDKTASMNYNPADNGAGTNTTPPLKSGIARSSATKIIDVMPFDRCEVGVTEFSSGPAASIQRMFFTTDKDSLKKDVNKIAFGGGTDINSGFLGKNGNRGALDLAAFARWKPFIVFLTDGLHDPQFADNQQLKTGEIIARANAINATVFVVGLGVDLGANPISSIATSTNGRVYNNLTTQAELEGVLGQILQLAQLDGNLAPCELEWDTDCDGGNIEVEFQLGNKPKDTFTYTLDPLKLPILNTTKATNSTILNVPVGSSQSVDVVIDAQQNFLNVTGFNSTLPEFEVSNWGGTPPPFKLNKGDKRTLKVAYKPTDKNCKEGVITLLSPDACTIKPIDIKGGTILIEDINVGFATKGVTKTDNFTSKFCNNSCGDIEITGFRVGGNNLTEFKINNAITILKSGECLDMNISYTPVDVQASTATYTIIAKDGSEYTANLTGTGSGLPEIFANDLAFGAISCGETEQDVTITNSGAIDMNISSVTLSNTTDFSIVGTPPTIVPAGGSVNVRVKFKPSNKNPNFTSDLTIINDSDNDKNKIVKITAQKNQIDFSTNVTTIDFGIVCPNETITREVEITNLSNVEVDFLGSTTIANGFSVDKFNWKLNSNIKDKVQITFTAGSLTDGIYNGVWSILDENCKEKTINVNVTAKVVTPLLNANPTNFTATIGNSDDKIITIFNPTDRDLIVDLSTDNAQYTIIQPTIVNNVTIQRNNNLNVTVRYTPDKNNPLPNGNLIAKTTSCNYTGNMSLIGDPKFAIADLIIDENHSGLIGDKITIPVKLRNKFEVLASGAKTINFSIEFDAALLEPTGTTPIGALVGGKRRLPLTINLDGTNADQDLNLEFIITDGGSVTETDIDIISTPVVDNNSISINTDNGKFTVIIVNLKAKVFPVSAKPGDVIDFPLYVRDKNKSLKNFHKGIKTFVKYNSTTTEVLGLPSTIDNTNPKFRDVEITELIKFSEVNSQNNSPLLIAEPGDILLTTLKIRALLGNEIVSNIIIYNSSTIEGKVNIEADTTQFTILGVCIDLDGSPRLIDPLIINPGINVKPNPSSSIINIDFTPIESGYYSLKLVNMAGAVIRELVNEEIIISNQEPIISSINKQTNNYKLYNFNLDANNFTNGIYFVILNTPTQNFVEKLNINK